jgi:HK97 family phage major capsid protein
MKLEKLTGLYYATDELLQDAAALTAEVNGWYNEEFAFVCADAVFNGSGAGQPLGILNAPALVTVAQESGQGVDSIVHANLANMYTRMTPSERMKAKWYMNNDVWSQLLTLEDSGSTRPIFMGPGNQIMDAPNGTIYGRPIEVVEHCATLGDVGDIVFASLGRYRMIEKGGVDQTTSIHVRFLQGETAFKFKKRLNGEPRERTAITPANGTVTTSPFVALATRTA